MLAWRVESTPWKTRVFCAWPQAVAYLWSQECLRCVWDGECSWQHDAVQTYWSQFRRRWLRYWEEARGWGCRTQLRGWLSPGAGTHLALSAATATCTHPVTSKIINSTAWFGCCTEKGRRNRECCRKALASCLSKRLCSTCVHLRGGSGRAGQMSELWVFSAPQEAPCSQYCACAGPQPQAGSLGLQLVPGWPCFHWGSQADRGEDLMMFRKHWGVQCRHCAKLLTRTKQIITVFSTLCTSFPAVLSFNLCLLLFVLCIISKSGLLIRGHFNLLNCLVKRPKLGCEDPYISFNCYHLATFTTDYIVTDCHHRISSGIASFEESSKHGAALQ